MTINPQERIEQLNLQIERINNASLRATVEGDIDRAKDLAAEKRACQDEIVFLRYGEGDSPLDRLKVRR